MDSPDHLLRSLKKLFCVPLRGVPQEDEKFFIESRCFLTQDVPWVKKFSGKGVCQHLINSNRLLKMGESRVILGEIASSMDESLPAGLPSKISYYGHLKSVLSL